MTRQEASLSCPFPPGGIGSLRACWTPVSSLPMVLKHQDSSSPSSTSVCRSHTLDEDPQKVSAAVGDNIPFGRGGVAAFACLGVFRRDGKAKSLPSSFRQTEEEQVQQTEKVLLGMPPGSPGRQHRDNSHDNVHAAEPRDSLSFMDSHSVHRNHKEVLSSCLRQRNECWGLLVGGASRYAASNEVFLWNLSDLESPSLVEGSLLYPPHSTDYSSACLKETSSRTVQQRGRVEMRWLRVSPAMSATSPASRLLTREVPTAGDSRDSISRGVSSEQVPVVSEFYSREGRVDRQRDANPHVPWCEDQETTKALASIPAVSGSACFCAPVSSDYHHTRERTTEETKDVKLFLLEGETHRSVIEEFASVLAAHRRSPVPSSGEVPSDSRENNEGFRRNKTDGEGGRGALQQPVGDEEPRISRANERRERGGGEERSLDKREVADIPRDRQEGRRSELVEGRKIWFHGGQNFFTNEVYDNVFSMELIRGESKREVDVDPLSLRVRRLSLPSQTSCSPASDSLSRETSAGGPTPYSTSSPFPSTRPPSTSEADHSVRDGHISSSSFPRDQNDSSVCVSSPRVKEDMKDTMNSHKPAYVLSSPTAGITLDSPSVGFEKPLDAPGVSAPSKPSSSAPSYGCCNHRDPACLSTSPVCEPACPSSSACEKPPGEDESCQPPRLSSHAVAPVLWEPVGRRDSCRGIKDETEELFLFFGGGRGCQTFSDVWLFSPTYHRWVASSSFLGPELLISPRSSEREVSSLIRAACDEGSRGRTSGTTGDQRSHAARKQPRARELASLNALPSPRLPLPAFILSSSEIYDDCHVACFVLMGGRGESGVFDDIWVLYLIGRPARSRRGEQGEAREEEETQRGDRKTAKEQNDVEGKNYRSKRRTEEEDCLRRVTVGQYDDDPLQVDQGGGLKMKEKKGHPFPAMTPSVVRKKDSIVAPSILDSECFSTVWRRCGQLPLPLCCHNAHLIPASSVGDPPQVLLFGGADATFSPTNQLLIVAFRSPAHEEDERKDERKAEQELNVPLVGNLSRATTETLFPVLRPTFTFISVASAPCARFAAASLFLPPDVFPQGCQGVTYSASDNHLPARREEETADACRKRLEQGQDAGTLSKMQGNHEKTTTENQRGKRVKEIGTMLLFGGVTHGVDLNDVWMLRLWRDNWSPIATRSASLRET
ncbi:hypothetical protein CSUI_000433 [Cystoisospora suis]|uniref:Kelch repeat-containing protein n=1 Tax=Cystoisospora suis TaxID=483139 RepID=A0A2C6LE26_9APIC|nr:hypothetical protein CSUI_000433 [Cystoisospora suis]